MVMKVFRVVAECDSPVTSISWSPGGDMICSGNADGSVNVWMHALGEFIRTMNQKHDGIVTTVVWSPDGKFLASGSYDRTIKLWDPETGDLIRTIQNKDCVVSSIAWNPDNIRLAVASMGDAVKVVNIETGEILKKNDLWFRCTNAVAWCMHGDNIVSGNGSMLFIWTDERTTLYDRPLKKGSCVSLVCSEYELVASGNSDGTIKIWDYMTHKLSKTIHAHDNAVFSVSWKPGGKILASGSADKLIKLWDAGTGTLLTVIDQHTDAVTAVSWSPDGRYLVSACRGRKILSWSIIFPN